MRYIQVAKTEYGLDEVINLLKVIFSFKWNEGKFCTLFEKEFSNYLGNPFTALTNSGSSANLLAVASLTSHLLGDRALKRGDHFITTPLAFPTTINPSLIYGLKPIFVDINPETLNIDENEIEKAITPKTKLIMFAHTLGRPANMPMIMEIARKHKLWVIEDCCDALGTEINGQKVGTFGDLSTYSFYPAHHISMVEGGAVSTRNPLLSRIVRSFRDWGRHCWCKPGKDNTCGRRFKWKLGKLPEGYDHKYTYSEIGYNLKPTEFQAAVGVAQLKKLKRNIERRKENHQLLSGLLLGFNNEPQNVSWFGYVMFSKRKNELVRYFEDHGIATRPIFAGNITKHPGYLHLKAKAPNCDYVLNNGFWIGCHPHLTIDDILYIKQVYDDFQNRDSG